MDVNDDRVAPWYTTVVCFDDPGGMNDVITATD
jgi:hypothetical protein